jgi:hypothetical protein
MVPPPPSSPDIEQSAVSQNSRFSRPRAVTMPSRPSDDEEVEEPQTAGPVGRFWRRAIRKSVASGQESTQAALLRHHKGPMPQTLSTDQTPDELAERLIRAFELTEAIADIAGGKMTLSPTGPYRWKAKWVAENAVASPRLLRIFGSRSNEIQVTMEVCRVRDLNQVYCIDWHRSKGSVWAYKRVYEAWLERFKGI